MSPSPPSRREFLKGAGTVAGAGLVGPCVGLGSMELLARAESRRAEAKADYTLRIAASAIEIGHKRIVSGITYNGQFPGPCCGLRKGSPSQSKCIRDGHAGAIALAREVCTYRCRRRGRRRHSL